MDVKLIIILLLIMYILYNNIEGGAYPLDNFISDTNCYYDMSYFPELTPIQTNSSKILNEVKNVKTNLWYNWIPGQLDVILLYFHGEWVNKAVPYLPTLYNLLKDIPKVKSVSISRLRPGIQIMPHKDWAEVSNKYLRCHFALSVPEKSGTVCDNWVRFYKNNEWIVLDVSRTHSVFNLGNEDRYIIIIDMIRPKNIPLGTCKVEHDKRLINYLKTCFDENQLNLINKNIKLLM